MALADGSERESQEEGAGVIDQSPWQAKMLLIRQAKVGRVTEWQGCREAQELG